VVATRNSVAWLGHSCTAIRLDGLLVVTDPLLRRRVIHLRRETAVDPKALADADAILISHTHYDHLDLPSLDQLDLSARGIVPAGAGNLLRRRGFRRSARPTPSTRRRGGSAPAERNPSASSSQAHELSTSPGTRTSSTGCAISDR
jgi:L-ascorbate metabolism protein UlaG (beta-lactamase superfamily)